MKIKAKPRSLIPGILVVLTILIIYIVKRSYHFESLLYTKLEIMQYIFFLISIFWVAYFKKYYRIEYETREDGIYILQGEKTLRNIPYSLIKRVRTNGRKIYISTRGILRIDEVLRPISDVNNLCDEIKSRITEGENK